MHVASHIHQQLPHAPSLSIFAAVKEPELLSSVRERYTTVKRLVVTPAKPDVTKTESKNVLVEVQFTGPQPSEGPGSLLCDLLCGVGVDARPVELPRGRKKRARTGAASPEASDSGEKSLSVHRSALTPGKVCPNRPRLFFFSVRPRLDVLGSKMSH